MPPDTFIPPHGGYRDLLSYQKAEAVFDLAGRFCERFPRRGDRTIDQMIQAARSGKQNNAEGDLNRSGSSTEGDRRRTARVARTGHAGGLHGGAGSGVASASAFA